MAKPLSVLLALSLALAGCKVSEKADAPDTARSASGASAIAPILTAPDAVDVHSYAKPLEARVTHVALDLTVDFNAKRLGGTATLDIDAKPGQQTIILDDKGLEIAKIATADGKPLAFKVGAADANIGAPLEVTIGDARKIVITYKSAPDAGALQWLTPQQTAGGRQPFLFSQGEAIENRSWIPTQDSPGIRQSWEARITVPKPLTAVMSAVKAAEPVDNGQTQTFSYKMVHPVAPYLIAIAVGDLKFQDLGPRTGVWAEPATLPKAAKELEDTEKMVSAAEQLYGPYKWGRYDVIVLPPSFPFGGMENPNLTFLTPTFIAGDKSLVSLVAHELAHSWSGNLATNATWGDIWLNEGMTTYAERRIVENLYGEKQAKQQVSLGIDAMNTAVGDAGGPTGKDSALHLDLKGRHPDEGLTDIAYEKGAALLRMIEATVGRDTFDAYLKGYFDRHAFQPVSSSVFLKDLRDNLVKGDQALEAKLKLDDWVYKPGIPANSVPADAAAFAPINQAVDAFKANGAVPTGQWAGWSTDERLHFLTKIDPVEPTDRLAALDQGLSLSRAGNNEVRFAFLKLAVDNKFDPAVPAVDDFLGSLGRGKFVRPLYKSMASNAWGKPIATRIYAKYRDRYHPLVQRDVDKMGIGGGA